MPKMTTSIEVELELEIEYTIDPPDPEVGITGSTLAEVYLKEMRVMGQRSWWKVPNGFDVDLYAALEGPLEEAIWDHYNAGEE